MDLALRDTLESDLPIFFEHQCDPLAFKMAAFTPRDESPFKAHWKNILADPDITKRTVLVEKQVAGYVVCFEKSGRREIGYWIGREHWGKGVATRALLHFLQSVTQRPLYAGAARHNVGSIRVLEKCGFVLERPDPGPAPGDSKCEELILKLSDDAETFCP